MRNTPIPMMAVTICTQGPCKQTFLRVGEWQKRHKNTHITGHKTSGIVLWLVTALLPTVHTQVFSAKAPRGNEFVTLKY